MTKQRTTEIATVSQPTGKFAGMPGKCEICGKPLLGSNDGIGSTCKGHFGKVAMFYKPIPTEAAKMENLIHLTVLCDKAQELGKSRSFAVILTGGDAGTKKPVSPIFQIFVQGKRKFVSKAALAELERMVKSSK